MLFFNSFFIRCCLLVPLLVLLMGCGKSDLSSGAVTDPSLLQVNVVVHRRVCYDGNASSIKAYLKDKAGKSVANKAIQILVNGQALRLNGGSSNYYGAFPYYELPLNSAEVVQGGKTYAFSIVLTDGSAYELGSIQTQPNLTTNQLVLPKTHSRKQPLPVKWQRIEPGNYVTALWKRWQGEDSRSQLTVSKIHEKKDQWGTIIADDGSGDQADYLTIDIGTGAGSQLIPRTYFDGPQARFNALSLMLTSTRTKTITQAVRSGSNISSEHSTFYRIDVVD